MRLLRLVTGLTASLIIAVPGFAQQASGTSKKSSIDYPSVAAALGALKARTDVKISIEGGWTIVNDQATSTLWSFTPQNHPAYPAAVKRTVVERDGAVYIEMSGLCEATKSACDKLMAEFQALNDKMREAMNRKGQPPQQKWAPSDDHKTRATTTLSRFFAAIDESRYREAYELLTPGMRSLMSFDQFVSFEQDFKATSGGEPSRTDTRITWYKDPPKAQAPGVYAAFDIKCRFRNINTCAEVVILHEQSTGAFLVMRHERNYVDKDTEQRIRDSKK